MLLAAAAGLAIGQWLLVGAIAAAVIRSARGEGDDFAVPSELWRGLGTALPILLAIAAAWINRRTGRAARIAIGLGCLLLPLLILIALIRGPGALDSVQLSDGSRLVLALEAIPTDSVYSLYRASWGGLLWTQAVPWLDYSEDGRFTGGERIVVTRGERFLLIARAGLWTDCFRLVRARPVVCEIAIQPVWSDPGYEAAMHRRSAIIARLAGIVPPPA